MLNRKVLAALSTLLEGSQSPPQVLSEAVDSTPEVSSGMIKKRLFPMLQQILDTTNNRPRTLTSGAPELPSVSIVANNPMSRRKLPMLLSVFDQKGVVRRNSAAGEGSGSILTGVADLNIVHTLAGSGTLNLGGQLDLNIVHTFGSNLTELTGPQVNFSNGMIRRRVLPALQFLPQETINRSSLGPAAVGSGNILTGSVDLNLIHSLSNSGTLNIGGLSDLSISHMFAPMGVLDIGGTNGLNVVFTLASVLSTGLFDEGASDLNIGFILGANGVLDIGGTNTQNIVFTLNSNLSSGLFDLGASNLNINFILGANGVLDIGGTTSLTNTHVLGLDNHMEWAGPAGMTIDFTLGSNITELDIINQIKRFQLCMNDKHRFVLDY